MARKKAQSLPQPEPEMLAVCGDILQETEDAILLFCEGENYWLPKSQIEYAGERGDEYVEVALPEWLAEEKGLSDRRGYIPHVPTEAQEEQIETILLYGKIIEEKNDEHALFMELIWSDETVTGFHIQRSNLLSFGSVNAAMDFAEITKDYASEKGFIELPSAFDDIGIEQGASTVPNDRHWLKQETITVTQELTQKEKAEYAEEMAQFDDEIEELENERDSVMKSLKKQIDAKEDERRKLSKVVRGGSEEREIFCDKLADYNTCEMVWTDAHPPHDEVKRQKMTSEERQLPLEKKSKPETDTAPSETSEGMDFDALTVDAETEKHCETCVHDGAVTNDGEPCESCDENLSLWQLKPDDTPMRGCSNCANLHQTFSENDVDPCHACSDEAKENWAPMSTGNAIPVGKQPNTHSGVVQ